MTTLYSFQGDTDGNFPYAGLMQASDGNFYGTTWGGGLGYGVVFKITPGGTLSTLYTFSGAEAGWPYAPLIQAPDGNFYGTSSVGGVNSDGTIFSVTPSGRFSLLHSFNGTDGSVVRAGLLQGTNGILYGTASAYTNCYLYCGTVFSFSEGFQPLVIPQPTTGLIGTPVTILGTNLTGSTSVTFNGTAASFNVVSASQITTTVPTGASTGPIQVSTPNGTLISNVNFTVPYVLTVSQSGDGSITSSDGYINCPGVCSHTYMGNTMVTLTANPASRLELERLGRRVQRQQWKLPGRP